MDLDELELIKNVYGWFCIALFAFWGGEILFRNKPGTTQRLLSMGIVGWSGYISLGSEAASIDFLLDWIITVPLIFLSLSYKGIGEGWRYNTLLLGFVSIGAILLAGDDFDYPTLLTVVAILWVLVFIRGMIGITGRSGLLVPGDETDFSRFSMFEKATYVLLIAYPLLFFLAGSTVNDMDAYAGSMLDDWGIHYYTYATILILLSVVCKIGLSIYHVMTDPEGGLTERSTF